MTVAEDLGLVLWVAIPLADIPQANTRGSPGRGSPGYSSGGSRSHSRSFSRGRSGSPLPSPRRKRSPGPGVPVRYDCNILHGSMTVCFASIVQHVISSSHVLPMQGRARCLLGEVADS